ncbi:hypothetical protein BGZ61DRAFT_561414 [Ilyonectria robusta]|uniref:uncharacterized protein n=1 Tax=Ilyonectria robusta TaxID=1079257 RepID=UPI001E8D9805|nr:uncharacterized protein BGZ61DRAFT_561414 [Ilyonectria robusta]KAH8665374.1 hypothetical protein BGZ61DRAFT_561414 [Ilyonectria robusta]
MAELLVLGDIQKIMAVTLHKQASVAPAHKAIDGLDGRSAQAATRHPICRTLVGCRTRSGSVILVQRRTRFAPGGARAERHVRRPSSRVALLVGSQSQQQLVPGGENRRQHDGMTRQRSGEERSREERAAKVESREGQKRAQPMSQWLAYTSGDTIIRCRSPTLRGFDVIILSVLGVALFVALRNATS